jgi:hypothetical protein
MKAWRHMADKGRALGLEIGAWFAPHFSPRAPIFAEHPEYRMIDAAGQGSGGGYGLDKISAIGLELERLAKLSNREAIREQIEDLQQYTAALNQRFGDE